jgi:hypothetical protein
MHRYKNFISFYLIGLSLIFSSCKVQENMDEYAAGGLIFDSEGYAQLDTWEPDESFGFANTLPSRVSYRKFTPNVRDQGAINRNEMSCVGYAIGYAQITTQQNIAMGVTDPIQRTMRAMDPYFVFPLIKVPDWCSKGTAVEGAVWVLQNYGNKPANILPLLNCNNNPPYNEFTLGVAKMNTIESYYSIDMSDMENEMKGLLNARHTISIGNQLTRSFTTGSGVYGGNWSPSASERMLGGHAMLIVGYDDYRNGGSFEVMNSWGTRFGDEGYVWITYKDMRKYCFEAYAIDIGDSFKKGKCSLGDCANSWSRYTYNNGNVYEGMVNQKKPNVYGSMVFSNGDYFGGSWSNGRKHGWGITYIYSQRQWYLQKYSNDILLSSEAFGFAQDEEEIEFLKEQCKNLQQIFPGDLIDDPDSEEFTQFEEEYEVPENPVVISD